MACGGGQVPVSCSLCEEDTRINWKCLNCDMFMCDKCKEKIHVKCKLAMDHKVVSIQDVGLHEDEIDFSNINCKNHLNQICFMFCKSCDCLVCPLYIIEIHNGHDLVVIREGYEIRLDKLKKKQKNIGTNIDQLKKRKAETKAVENTEHSKMKNTKKKMKAQKTALKNEVDKHIDELNSEILRRWEAFHQYTKTEEKKVSLLIGDLESKNAEVDDIIKSKHAERVFLDDLGIAKSMEETITLPCSEFDYIPTFLPGQIIAYNIGSLQNVSTKFEIKIIKQFETEITNVFYMAACSEKTLWITNQEKVKIEGRSLKIIDQKNIDIYDMALTPSKDLLLVTKGPRLKQISGQSGEMTYSKYEVKGLVLLAVHVNSDGKVTVGAYSGDLVYPAVGRRVVIVMDRSGKLEATYEFDRHGNPIFTNVRNITRTKNGNICVVDTLSEDLKGRVVILSEDGDVLNTFNGNPEVNTDKIPFKPLYVFTTPFDNIIISNRNYSILYFLNNSGNYISWCDTSKIGILYPRSFSSTDAGKTYVGCLTSKGNSNKVKIYEVNIL